LLPLCFGALLAPVSATDEAAGDLQSYTPRPAAGVRDPLFAYVIAMAEDDVRGEISGVEMERLLNRAKVPTRLPHELVASITRWVGWSAPAAGMAPAVGKTTSAQSRAAWRPRRSPGHAPATLRLRFQSDVDVPIPYSILGYHPGSVHASRDLVLDEWDLGRMRLPGDRNNPSAPPRYLEEVRLLVIRQGLLEVDIDWWVDKIMGKKLDDTMMLALALCRFEGKYYGIATGRAANGMGRSGTFDFAGDAIVFPAPAHFKYAGRTLRARAERLLAQVMREEAAAANATTGAKAGPVAGKSTASAAAVPLSSK
jgi:hypothetical protein